MWSGWIALAISQCFIRVKIDPFYRRDDEDPYEWIDNFEAAATANQWPDNRKIEIATGYLRDAARDWYQADRANINQWHQGGQADTNFDDRFRAYFTPENKQNQ